MKVYITETFDAEPYSTMQQVDVVFLSREKAEAYLKEKGEGPHGENLDEHEYGYYYSRCIIERTVRED